jgi:APA family basic amino acid/polyamine antiporter
MEKKQLNLFNIFCLGLGGAIGSGIFVMLGIGIGYTGRSIFASVIVGCFIMLLAYLYHIIMSSMFVLKGGDYSFKALTFGPTLTGISGLFTVLNGMGIAMYAIYIVDYASQIFPAIAPFSKAIAILIITLFFASTVKGAKFVATLNSIMTIVLVASIALFVSFGLTKVKPGYFASEGFLSNGMGGFGSALAVMSFACMGTTMAPVSMMTVTKNSKKTIPIAILFVTVGLAVIYGLMSIVAAGVLPVEEVAFQNLSLVATEIFPHWLYVVFILGGAVFAIATSLIAVISMLRYPIQQVAEDGWLPAVFKKTTKSGYPYASMLAFYLISIVPVLFNFSLDILVNLVMLPLMILCFYQNLNLIRLVKQYPKQWKNSVLHMPYPLLCLLSIIGAAADIYVSYNLFTMLTTSNKIMVVILLVICIFIAVIRIKTKAVDVTKLEEVKRMIAEEASQS